MFLSMHTNLHKVDSQEDATVRDSFDYQFISRITIKILAVAHASPQPSSKCTYGIHFKILGAIFLELSCS